MAKASVKYIPLHEEYKATASSDDVSGAPKKGKVPECSDSDTRWKELEGGAGVDETKNSKRRRLISTKMLEAFENGGGMFSILTFWLTIDGEQKRFIGLKCKVYWPLDENWYSGHISGYNPLTDRHEVKYNDGDEELPSNERISFHVSPEEMQQLNLSCVRHPDVDDMVALAATLDHCSHADPSPGDMIWAKVSGHPMWPAIVLDESASGNFELLNKISGEQSVLVQFFGTHDFARLSKKHIIPFLKGLLSELHRKCKRSDFQRSLMEAKMYLGNEKLPNRMLSLQCSNTSNFESASREEDATRDEEIPKNLNLRSCPFEVGGLQIRSLGKILKDSELLYDCNYICPEGYTAVRKFPLISDPKKCILYKMEVLRDGDMLNKPLFRVTSEKGFQVFSN
ncbi:hypothetical protein POM88_002143 [Heracleum sosnowskyi]|uniref:PWWP domain-containing protein n=1 Tax=Heracleum sosnowskyi TaxID=360622 RepID=A0AAD8JGA1_9APIA|nr:hypothetical protein POM88_002143 [Heracleum sosnowskyi]